MNPKALYNISYGLYIVSSKWNSQLNGQTANAVMQVSNDPVTVALSINKDNLTHQFISQSGLASISVLEKDTPLFLIGKFGFNSGRDLEKFKEVEYELSSDGLPYVTEHTLAYFKGPIVEQMDAHTHTVFLCRITEGEVLTEGEPMTYAYYHQVKQGKTPSAAPTARKSDDPKGREPVDEYVCTVCGYVYDPEEGDPDSDISPGTSFDEIPDDWICPVCGASKDAFEKTG